MATGASGTTRSSGRARSHLELHDTGSGPGEQPLDCKSSGINTLGSGDPAWDIRSKIDTQFGAGAFDAAVRRALNTWAAAANVRFVQLADSGGSFAGSVTPDIRIGAFHFPVGDFAAVRPGVLRAMTSTFRMRFRAIWR